MSEHSHIVAICGGAVAGAEAVAQLTQRNIRTVVFEQNTLPYGKIEDGLPKWHTKLRDQEEHKINQKLQHPLVSYVPNIKLGENIDLYDISKNWGFSAVLLATGAWKDRPIPIEGISSYINKGLYYQNPFIYWFNHFHEPNYSGYQYETPDGTIIIGGGLASLDVAKVLMFETVKKALKARGHVVDLFSLDKSIAKVLIKFGLTLQDLDIKGCSLYYRRRIEDMPLSPMTPQTETELAKTEKICKKILANYQRKYLFNMYPCHVPSDKIVENGKLAGMIFQKTKIENGRMVVLKDSKVEVRSPLTIASIGSIPQAIKGIPMKRQVYKVIENECCRIEGYGNVYALGNAVTGRGNIKESMKHGREITQELIDKYLEGAGKYEEGFEKTTLQVKMDISKLIDKLQPCSSHQQLKLMERVTNLQKEKNYEGDFMVWVKKHLPVRLENMKDKGTNNK